MSKGMGCPGADGVRLCKLNRDKENTGLESTWLLGERRQEFFVMTDSGGQVQKEEGHWINGWRSLWKGRLLEKFQYARLLASAAGSISYAHLHERLQQL